jgi:hypothetical protein
MNFTMAHIWSSGSTALLSYALTVKYGHTDKSR